MSNSETTHVPESGADTVGSSENGEEILPERPGTFWAGPHAQPEARGLEAVSEQLWYITLLLERLVSGIDEVKNAPVENPKAPPPSEGGRSIVVEEDAVGAKFNQLKGQLSIDDIATTGKVVWRSGQKKKPGGSPS